MRQARLGPAEAAIGHRASRLAALIGATAVALVAMAITSVPAQAQGEEGSVLIYTGTTGFRHADAIDQGRPVVQTALEDLGYEVTWEDCDGTGGAANNCDNPDKNPRIFTSENLAQYDGILFLNSSWSWAGGGLEGPLLDEAQQEAVIGFVQAGGGIAAVHNMTDAGAGVSVWDWWDGGPDSVIGTTMAGHAATDLNNEATVQVADRHHLSTRDLDDTYAFGDEHYNWNENVRGTHHVLASLDERSYEPGENGMGYDHPISWCKSYDGANVEDGTGDPKPYDDGRTWITGMGHFGESYVENGGDNPLVQHIVGGVRWIAGEGDKTDCGGTVWENFTRTILVDDVVGPIGLDVAADGKVYWSEIGPTQGFESEGYVKMHDPEGPANNNTTVATIPTRADHGNSEDGVLGMSLEPGFDLTDPEKRDIYVYYSPRNPDWPTTGDQIQVGYNLVSRFTLNADGTEFVADSEREILRVPKAKISGDPSGFPGGPTDSGPGHVGGAGLDFDSEGNLYLGVGDDVSPNAPGHDRYIPMDHRAPERWDARKTAANTADLRGKVLRIAPVDQIPAGTDPGVGATYEIPGGNMFEPGTENTRPEIYAMGFRQPFTIHTDPANPGTVVVGEFCHDNNVNLAERAPAGACEWNKVDEPGFHGWPFCVGDNAPINTAWRWDYTEDAATGDQYDCSLDLLPADLSYDPPGGGDDSSAPTFEGLDQVPGPAVPATVWRKYPGTEGEQDPMDFGDLSAGGQQPVTGPVYRYDPETAGEGAFPPYYDGSWLITNRGDPTGFWKDVRLRSDDNEMLEVNDWLPTDQFGSPSNSFVIPTQFGPDGALYMARWDYGCCRNELSADRLTQLVKIEFTGPQECTDDIDPPTVEHEISGQPSPDAPDTYVGSATLSLAAGDVGCAGVDTVEYRVNGGEWQEYSEPVEFDEPGSYTVDYRATDTMGNTSEPAQVSFAVVPGDGCVGAASDEFDGTALDTTRWPIVRNPAELQPAVADGSLTMPILDEVDGAGTGPLSYVAQQAPAGDWSATTKVTIDLDAYDSWEQAGLILWQSDGNFVKTVFGRDEGSGERRFEITSDNPEDVRQIGPSVAVDDEFPTTAWIRMFREGHTIGAEFAPDVAGEPGEWTAFGGTRPVDTDPPREGEGVLIGPFAGSDIAPPRDGTAAFDFVRFEPELDCPDEPAPPGPPPEPGPPTTPGAPPAPSASVDKPSKKESKLAKLLKGGIKVSGDCAGADAGSLKLSVKAKQAKELGLGKRTTLARSAVSCRDDGTFSTKLKAKGKAKRALKQLDGSLRAKLRLRMSGPGGEVTDSTKLVLKGGGRKE